MVELAQSCVKYTLTNKTTDIFWCPSFLMYAEDYHDSTHSNSDKWEWKCELYGAV